MIIYNILTSKVSILLNAFSFFQLIFQLHLNFSRLGEKSQITNHKSQINNQQSQINNLKSLIKLFITRISTFKPNDLPLGLL